MTQWGFNFSRRQCAELGLDWQDTLKRFVESSGLRQVRLSVYWDEPLEAAAAELDLAQSLGLEVMLTVGAKAQRWPEFYLPTGVTMQDYQKTLPAHVEAVTKAFALHPSLRAWQVENEPFDPSGPTKERVSRESWISTRNILRDHGGAKPLWLNFWGNNLRQRDHFAKLDAEILSDISGIGFNFYTRVPRSWPWGYHGPDYSPSALTEELQKLRAAYPHLQFCLSELQAEPWERFNYKENPEQIRSTSPELFVTAVNDYGSGALGRELSIIYLWGIEYLIWSDQLAHYLRALPSAATPPAPRP